MPEPKEKPEEKPAEEKPEEKPAALVYDTWINEQDDEIKALLDGNTTGLKSALESERESRKDLETQLRGLAKKADGDQKIALEDMANKLETKDTQAAFYEDAHSEGVTNLKLAYTVAVQDDLFDRKGNADFDKLKTDYPELFSEMRPKSKSNAGNGSKNNQTPAGKDTFSDAIRTAANK